MANKEFKTRIKNKRDTAANWESRNPVILNGEIILVDTNAGELRAKIGNGTKTYTQLPFSDEALRGLITDKADKTHTHDDRYYTETEVNTKFSDLVGDRSVATQVDEALASAKTYTNEQINAVKAGSVARATEATKATQDGNGKVIADTYETKTDATAKLTSAKSYTDEQIGALKTGTVAKAGEAGYAETAGSADVADTALKATSDAAGNAITDTYETKTDAAAKLTAAKKYTDDEITEWVGDKTVAVQISTAIDEITPASIGAAAASHGTHVNYSTADPSALGTASAGTANTVSRGDHVHPAPTAISGNANTATTLQTTRYIDGVSFNGSADVTRYATCATAANVAAKTVSIKSGTFNLAIGSRVTVRFGYANSAANPTLNVGNTGAKAIKWQNTALPSSQYWEAGSVLDFIYNGESWDLIGVAKDNNTTYSNASTSAAGLMSASDKILLNNLDDLVGDKSVATQVSTAISQITPTSIGAATSGHNHDSVYSKLDHNHNSAYQSTITGGATTITGSNLTANRALISDSSGKVAVSGVTSTELGYLDGVTSNIQTQLNGKAASSHSHSNYVDLTSEQKIDGEKTFANGLYVGATGSSWGSGSSASASLTYADNELHLSCYEGGLIVADDTAYFYKDEVKKEIAPLNHTHNYAGSSSAGGSATSAVKLDTATAGSATQPAYFSGGKPIACTYTLGKSVPSDAKFTDTVYTLPAATSSALGGVKVGSNITNSSGTISLTKANVTAALGYTPPTSDTNTVTLNGKSVAASTKFYAPTTLQTTDDYFVVGGSSAPTWMHRSYVTASLYNQTADKFVTFVKDASNGYMYFRTGDATTADAIDARLGSNTARWYTVYSKGGDFSGTVTAGKFVGGFYNGDGTGHVNITLSSSQYYFKPGTTSLTVNSGGSSYRWSNVYSKTSLNVSSDLNIKTDLAAIDDRYIKLFDLIQPYCYKFIDGNSGRTHTGFISQYVESAAKEVGLNPMDLAFFCKDPMIEDELDTEGNVIGSKPVLDENGEQKYFYSLRYEEYIAIMTAKIKKVESEHKAEIKEVKEENASLRKELDELKELVNSLI